MFKKCAICGRKLNDKDVMRGIGGRCYKAAKEICPHIFDGDGNVVPSEVTEDDRFSIMEYMKVHVVHKKVCFNVPKGTVIEIIHDEDVCEDGDGDGEEEI